MPNFGVPSPAPAPDIDPSPSPPPEEPITFTSSARPSLFGIVGTAIGSTTMATITCADAAMTIMLSQAVAGLTWAYASNVLSVSGTPTASGVTRVVVSYISSDGERTVRGSTEHEITIVSVSEEVTVDAVYSISGRVGYPMKDVLVAEVSANFGVDLYLQAGGNVPGLTFELDWAFDSSSGSGTVIVSGTPTKANTFSVDCALAQKVTGIRKATFNTIALIGAAYQSEPPAPAPPPIPPPPAPSPPPVPAPAPQPGHGNDPNLAATKVLMRFDTATGIAYDHRGNTFTSSGPSLTEGAVDQAALFSASSDSISGTVPALVISTTDDESLTAEAMVRLSSSALWTAVYTDGIRFMPVLSCVNPDGILVWSLGFVSLIEDAVPENPGRDVRPCMIVRTSGTSLVQGDATIRDYLLMATGASIPPLASRFVHLAGMLKYGSPSKLAAWMEGAAPYSGQCENFTGTLWRPTEEAKVIVGSAFVPRPGVGGVALVHNGVSIVIETMVPFLGRVDEARVKLDDHYGAYITGTNTQADIPAAARVIPWPNY
jgi:hypothetical protein